jgi:indolepyruvate decarboxylase
VPEVEVIPASGDVRVSSATFYPRLAKFLQPGDVVVSETGLSNLNLADLRMPAGVTFMNQPLWGSIGWATPAAFGAAIADRSRRVVLVTGDGSHQMTGNELGVIGRYDAKPVIFLLNNALYGVEELVADSSHAGNAYNRIAAWNYAAVPAAMGCADWVAARVTTVGELDSILAGLSGSNHAAFIEVDLGVEDVPGSLPTPFLNRMYGKTSTDPNVPTFAQALEAAR